MNKIYFQAWTNDARTDIVDFTNASLKGEVINYALPTAAPSPIWPFSTSTSS